MSKKTNKPTNPSHCLHADTLPRGKPPAPDLSVTPLTPSIWRTDPAVPEALDADASCRKRLLIRVQVEAGRVVSESSHYTED